MEIDYSIHIMVVDDSSDARVLLRRLLGRSNLKNLTMAENGEEALKLLELCYQKNNPVQLILADWRMPNLSGFELFERIKQNPHLKDIPFIMITAFADDQKVRDAIALGIADYIVKPFNAERLYQKICMAVSKQNKLVSNL